MIKETITYVDYEGNTRTEDCWFHLTKAEIVKWLTTSGDYTLDKVLKRLVDTRNQKEVIGIFDDLIRKSYGRKSLDGRRFEKSEEIWKEFCQTEAYSQLFINLLSDDKFAVKFITGLVPKDLGDQILEEMGKENSEEGTDPALLPGA